jgi:hypothetical protein
MLNFTKNLLFQKTILKFWHTYWNIYGNNNINPAKLKTDNERFK